MTVTSHQAQSPSETSPAHVLPSQSLDAVLARSWSQGRRTRLLVDLEGSISTVIWTLSRFTRMAGIARPPLLQHGFEDALVGHAGALACRAFLVRVKRIREAITIAGSASGGTGIPDVFHVGTARFGVLLRFVDAVTVNASKCHLVPHLVGDAREMLRGSDLPDAVVDLRLPARYDRRRCRVRFEPSVLADERPGLAVVRRVKGEYRDRNSVR